MYTCLPLYHLYHCLYLYINPTNRQVFSRSSSFPPLSPFSSIHVLYCATSSDYITPPPPPHQGLLFVLEYLLHLGCVKEWCRWYLGWEHNSGTAIIFSCYFADFIPIFLVSSVADRRMDVWLFYLQTYVLSSFSVKFLTGCQWRFSTAMPKPSSFQKLFVVICMTSLLLFI